MVLDNVRYDCGPGDEIVIDFEATAETPFSGRAELAVLDDTYGSVRVELGPTPSEYLMDIHLSQEAFDVGEGLVRVMSDDGSVVAKEPVVQGFGEGTWPAGEPPRPSDRVVGGEYPG